MTDGLEYLGRARLQGLTLLVVVFLVGVLAGAAGDRLLLRPRPSEQRPPEQRPPEPREGQRLPKVLEDMDLTPVQRAAIDSILASGRPRNEAIMNEVLPRLRAVSDSLQQGIRAVLTPAQAAEFNAYQRAHPPRMMAPSSQPPREGRPPDGGTPGGPRDRRPPPPPREELGSPHDSLPPDAGPSGRRPPPPPGGPRGRRPPPPPGDGPPREGGPPPTGDRR
jgi:hypothetical protein